MHLQTQSEANVGWIFINRARTERMQFQFVVRFFSRSTQVILPPGSYVRCDLNLNPKAVTRADSPGPETASLFAVTSTAAKNNSLTEAPLFRSLMALPLHSLLFVSPRAVIFSQGTSTA